MIITHNSDSSKRTLDYEQTLIEVQIYLRSLERGGLSVLSNELDIEYKMLIKLKNGNLDYQAPLVLERLLEYFLERPVAYEKKHLFTFDH
jgi:hypothetical protein